MMPPWWYHRLMKTKTSISLSPDLLAELDRVVPEGGRSELIEKAIWQYLELSYREIRDRRDLELLDGAADRLNSEALEALKFQPPI